MARGSPQFDNSLRTPLGELHLAARQAARAAEAIACGVDRLLVDQPLHDSVDEPLAIDLASVLGALRRQ